MMNRNNLLLLSLALALVCSHLTVGIAQNTGAVKNAWPEYRFQAAEDVGDALVASGLVARTDIFIWTPSPSRSPPFNPGTDQSVWLYTTYDNSTVYQIPQRGKWHPNRVDPGWVDLVREDYDDAIETIAEEVIGVTVVYGPVGFIRTEDIRYDRVFLEVNDKGEVATLPKLG